MTLEHDEREWLEPDGLGGFAMGTVSGVRTRRYHGLLLTATTPPTGRMMLVNGFDAWVETASGCYAISSQRYAAGAGSGGTGSGGGVGDVVHPDGSSRIESFTAEPWPTWTYRLEDDTRLTQEIVVPHGEAEAIVMWRVIAAAGASTARTSQCRLIVRPFLSGRDYHATHHENGSVRTSAAQVDGGILWQPYDGVPAVVSRANARYEHQPDWYRRFLYTAERARGLDDTEDLWTPGWLIWDLASADVSGRGEAAWPSGRRPVSEEFESPEAVAIWHLCAEMPRPGPAPATATRSRMTARPDAVQHAIAMRDAERARRNALTARGPLQRAADAYLVRRGSGRTIVAGYPWFTDWGRDTFIALRGLCLSTGRLDEARDILTEWSGAVSEGMLPNRFVDAGDAPEFNAVDASLWFIIAVQDYCDRTAATAAADADAPEAYSHARDAMMAAIRQILEGYAHGTRYGIRLDDDGLLACGVPGVQLTWMDARVGDHVITPRIGKPVEVQALWLNALRIGAASDPRWMAIYDRGRASFVSRFWNDADGCLYDVVDVDHHAGQVDASCRPNQIFAIGGLPYPVLDGDRARRIVDTLEHRLLTPLGLRSLAPGTDGYMPRYGGGPAERDAAYHQGAVWPWLIGAFVDAWLRVRDRSPGAIAEAHDRFLAPLMKHLDRAGIGHVCEITGAEPPFTPDGCPFQAWSLGELLRVREMLGV